MAPQSILGRYAAAAALAAVAIAFERRYQAFFLPSIFLILYPAAFIAAVLGGTGPAMLNVALSAAGAYWIFHGPGPGRLDFSGEGLLRLGIFACFSAVGCWLIGRGRLAAKALRESEAGLRIFRALAENSSDFIGIADPDGVPIYVNPTGRALVGLPDDLPVGQTRMPEYYPPDVRPFATGVILKAVLEQGHWKGETWFRNFRTEQRIPVWDEHFMIRDAQGVLLGMGTVTRDLSERRRAEEALRRREADLRRAQAVGQVGSWRLDVLRNELAWSDQTYEIFGLSVGSPMTYDDFLSRVHPEDRARVESEWAAALRGKPYNIEHRIIVGGHVKWVHERAELEFNAQGRYVRCDGTVQDITERRRAEEEVRALREKERFQLALEAAASAMLIVDREGRISSANAKAEQLFGWAREELIGKSIEMLVPERFRAAHPGQRESFHREGTSQRPMGVGRDLYALRKDGTEFPVEIGLTRVAEGGQEFVVSSHVDITERKKAEAALRESEQRFRLLVQGTRDYAIYMHDLEGLLTVWNEGAERIFGWRADEIIGRPVSLFYVPEEEAQGTPARDLRKAAERGSVEVEGWRRRKDGSRFWASVLITHLRDANGKPIGYGKVTRDLTERREKTQELAGSNASLRQAVAELESFAYTISHDLRSPLRAMEGYSQLLLQKQGERLDPESRELLQKTRKAAVRLDRLIRDLLSYAAIARKPVELEPVDLDELIAHVVEHYPEAAKARLRTRTPLGKVRGQSSLLLQVVSNLLANAVKFVPAGREPEIEVWTERLETGAIRFVVKDNGIGIPKEATADIFKPFTRLHPKGGYEGTGIGLAIVQRAAERMGGRVGVESIPGQGSRFFIELPEARA